MKRIVTTFALVSAAGMLSCGGLLADDSHADDVRLGDASRQSAPPESAGEAGAPSAPVSTAPPSPPAASTAPPDDGAALARCEWLSVVRHEARAASHLESTMFVYDTEVSSPNGLTFVIQASEVRSDAGSRWPLGAYSFDRDSAGVGTYAGPLRVRMFESKCARDEVGTYAPLLCLGLPDHPEFVVIAGSIRLLPDDPHSSNLRAEMRDAVFARARFVSSIESWHLEVDPSADCFRLPPFDVSFVQ